MIFNMRAKEVLGVIESDSSELRGSYESALKINKIGGVCVQGENPTPDNPQEIKKSVVSEIRTHGAQLYDVGGVKRTALISVDDNGWITAEYDNTNGTSIMYMVPTPPVSESIKPNRNYLLVTEIKEISVSIFQVCSTDVSNNKSQFITDVIRNSTGISTRIITSREDFSDCSTLLRTIVGVNAGSKGKVVFRISVLEDTTITADTFVYEPYAGSSITLSQPIELYGIGDVQDTIEGGKVVRNFENLKLNSSLNWAVSASTERRYILYCPTTVKPYSVPMCTHYKGGNMGAGYPVWINVGNQLVFDTEFNTFDEWINFINTNDVRVLYPLETPVIDDLPLTDQIALSCLKTFHGATYVASDGEVQPTLNSDYATNLEGAITLQAHADNRIGKANTLVNRAEGDSNIFEVRVEHGLVYLYKDDVLHGVLGANNVITNGETYKTMNVRAEEDADFIALTNKKTNTICYYMNINQIPFTSAQYKEAHYFGGDARFTGRVVGNEHIVGKNLQAQQMVFAQAVEASIALISKGDVTAANNIEAQNELRGKDLHFTNMGVNGGAAQPVEWVWDNVLERYVLCSTGKVQGE